MKSSLLKGESIEKLASSSGAKEMPKQAMEATIYCYMCGRVGHMQSASKYAESGMRRCYECHKMANHDAKTY